MNTIKRLFFAIEDYLYGRHSGIPHCCALWYAIRNFHHPSELTGWEQGLRWGVDSWSQHAKYVYDSYHYVLCDECMSHAIVGDFPHIPRHLCRCHEDKRSLGCRLWARYFNWRFPPEEAALPF